MNDHTENQHTAPPAPPADTGEMTAAPAQTKVCRRCSVQSQTAGEFCPHCGTSFTKRRPQLGRKTVIAIVSVVVVLLGVAGGIAWKIQHDRTEEREAAATAREAKRDAEEKRAEAAAEAERAAAKAAAKAERAEKAVRASIIKQMQQSITKDAEEKVAEGILEGPIFYTSCDPLGGGSVDDLTALTTTFECLAVNEKLGGGQVRGWVFTSTVNWDEASWSWQLGD